MIENYTEDGYEIHWLSTEGVKLQNHPKFFDAWILDTIKDNVKKPENTNNIFVEVLEYLADEFQYFPSEEGKRELYEMCQEVKEM